MVNSQKSKVKSQKKRAIQRPLFFYKGIVIFYYLTTTFDVWLKPLAVTVQK